MLMLLSEYFMLITSHQIYKMSDEKEDFKGHDITSYGKKNYYFQHHDNIANNNCSLNLTLSMKIIKSALQSV